ncbi:tRNA (N6-threonylcarbamoyladenosine(37)-N6)-methyltransferase TrmO [bacterium SCSIO 12696]|nr:tRNA (N6-threonylcarbamoyladenosine(37)-N6)-methyltransferase TrmO [bacterium SCSIO 12696]
MSTHCFGTIGIVHSPYREKFAIPRQPGLVPGGKGRIELLPPYNHPDTVRDLQQFSHIWVLFVFHETLAQGWKPLVRPPRLGGNRKTGVFATRSTFRPNPLGMSVVALEQVLAEEGVISLQISGHDLLDQTPVVDIKPYVPYADSLPETSAGFASEPPSASIEVQFACEAEEQLHEKEAQYAGLREFICQLLSQDPRPAYRHNQAADAGREYGVKLYDFNVVWTVTADGFHVLRIEQM